MLISIFLFWVIFQHIDLGIQKLSDTGLVTQLINLFSAFDKYKKDGADSAKGMNKEL